MPSKAASGLAVFADSTQKTHILAVANFYGASTAYSIDTRRSGLAPSKLQEFNTKAAHDFEAAHVTTSAGLALPLLISSEYDGDATLSYSLAGQAYAALPKLSGWPRCADSDAAACASWAKGGECVKNPTFMMQSCPEACGRCAAFSGPIMAVQSLPGLGGTSARHLKVAGHDLLLVANYKEPNSRAVAAYAWHREASAWRLLTHIDAPGAGEFAHCRVASTGEDLLVISTWFANGSFSASSCVYQIVVAQDGGETGGIEFTRRQELPTHGSHDAECFTSPQSGQTILMLANGRRDDGTRDVDTAVYVYDHVKRSFAPLQSLPTVGAHDIELVVVPPGDETTALLAVVSNGASWRGGEEACDNDVGVYRWHEPANEFKLFQRLDVGGCTTFARAWSTSAAAAAGGEGDRGGRASRTLLAVAVERLRNGSYDADVAVFEWRSL